MTTISKFVLAAAVALTLGSSTAAMADNAHRQGGPGVVISQQNVLGSQAASASQGR